MAVSDEPKKSYSPLVSSSDAFAWLKANWPRYWEFGVLALIVLVGAGLRLWDLGERSLNHDESLHATYSWYIYIGNGYTHDPMMHGPFQFFANAGTWKVLAFLSSAPLISNFAHWGPNDYTARLAYALFGSVFITLPFFLRGYIGRTGALFAALFIAFSPVILYFNRFARGDTYMAIWTLGIVICMWRYMMERRPLYLYLIAGLLALSFATKEVTFMLAAMFLILAFYALQMLPINFAGLALILFAIILFIAEVKVVSHGLLTVGGVISLFLGSMMLIETPAEYMQISLTVIIPAVLVSAGFFAFAVTKAIRARLTKPTTGTEGLVGEVGMASTPLSPEGKVLVHGEFWNAISDDPIEKGDKVQVVGVKDLVLNVKKTS